MRVPKSTPRRAKVLAKLALRNGWTRGVELGVWNGATFRHLLDTCPALHMTGVDLWVPQPMKDVVAGGRAAGGRSYIGDDLEGFYQALLADLPKWEGRARLIRSDTVKAASEFLFRSVDFVFIDADHTYEGVAADIDAWRTKVRVGGMLLGHDYNPEKFPGVVQAVDERFGKRVEHHRDTVWAVQC